MKYLVALGGKDDIERSKQILDYTMRFAVPHRDSMLLATIIPEVEIDSAIAILEPSYPITTSLYFM